MGNTKAKLRAGAPALGGWMLIGHPAIAEIMAAEGFDWICVDLEHTTTDLRAFYDIALALKETGCDLLARLHSCDPVQAKLVLDAGARGIIVPSVNTPEQAAQAVAMAKFPPAGVRGTSLSRATGFGRDFNAYFARHNDEVIVAVMLEHIDAVGRADAILATPGIDAVFIGPYDLSASMGLAGQLDHPRVRTAQQAILEACQRHGVPPGVHIFSAENDEIKRRVTAGYRLIACSLDTLYLMDGCRRFLGKAELHD